MDQLQRFIDLVNKTGDKLVVFDKQNPDKSFVILAINDYERLASTQSQALGLTEDELADKINHDIAVWKNEQILDDVSEANFDWLNEEDEYDDDDELEEEELSYLYAESELSATETKAEEMPVIEQAGTNPAPTDNTESDDELLSAASDQPRADFQSLSDILDSKYDKNKINNWSIPSDRKRQAEFADDANQYETIGF